MTKMDNKYKGEVFKNDGTPVPEDEWIVFRAQDEALLQTLIYYFEECERMGCNEGHLNGIQNLINRVIDFQAKYPERCKVPD